MVGRCASALAPLVAFAVVSSAGAQPRPDQQLPGAIRSGITFVPVDVRVLDRSGNPVTDLTLDDFRLLDEGVPQPIRHYSTQVLTPAPPPAPGTRPAFRTVSSADTAPRNHRVILVVLGRGRLHGPSRGLHALTRFVRERLLPQDQVAVLGYNRANDFTTDHEKVARLLERFARANDGIEAKLNQYFSGLQRGYGSREIPAHVQEDIDAVFSGPVPEHIRTVPSHDAVQTTEARTPLSERFDGLEAEWLGTSLDDFVGGDLESMQDLGNLYGGVEYLRYLEGEKHLIYVTEYGIFLPSLDDERSFAAVASDARVAVDIVQVGGVAIEPMRTSRLPSPFYNPTAKFANRFLQPFGVQGMREISRLTGGQTFVFQYADRALDRLDRSTRFQYLLAYAPTDATWDGSYRRITVEVRRRGVTVLHRHGYFGSEHILPFDRRQAITYTRIAAAGGHSETVHDLALTLKPPLIEGPRGAPTAVIDLSIDLSRVVFNREDGRYVASLEVAIFCGDNRERVIGELWQRIALNLPEDIYHQVLKEGYRYAGRIDLDAKPRFIKAIVYDYGSDLVGTTVASLK